jgi:hypothetical protein
MRFSVAVTVCNINTRFSAKPQKTVSATEPALPPYRGSTRMLAVIVGAWMEQSKW